MTNALWNQRIKCCPIICIDMYNLKSPWSWYGPSTRSVEVSISRLIWKVNEHLRLFTVEKFRTVGIDSLAENWETLKLQDLDSPFHGRNQNEGSWKAWKIFCNMCCNMTKPNNFLTVHPAKSQVSLGIRPVWSESSLCTQWVAKDPSFLHADREDSDQTGRMPRLIWVFAGRTVTLLALSWGGSYEYLQCSVFQYSSPSL